MRCATGIVRSSTDRDVYLVLDDFGLGCAWRETNVEDTDLEAVIQDLLEGQYSNPVPCASNCVPKDQPKSRRAVNER